jgi:N-acetylneuraminic acid mutarotase
MSSICMGEHVARRAVPVAGVAVLWERRVPSWVGPLVVLGLAATARAADPCAGGWSSYAPMGVPRQETGTAVVGATVYVAGGFDATTAPSAVLEAYDPAADAWSTRAPMPAPLHHPGAAAVGGMLYVVGGLAGASFDAVASMYAYDPVADVWSVRAPLPAPRGAIGIAVVDGRIYAVGGYRDGGSVADAAVYDPAADRWTALPPMPTARDHLAAAAIDGIVYAVGGRTAVLFDRLEAYDPRTDRWTSRAPMPTARGGLAATAVLGRLFAFGGEGNAADPLGIFRETEAWDAAADRWSRLPDMPTPRHGMAAAAMGTVVWVPGGATVAGFGVSGANEAFTPPAGGTLGAPRVRVARRRRADARLALRATLGGLADAPDTRLLRLRLLDGDRALFAATLPPGTLAGRGPARFRHRDRGRPPRIRALDLRRRAGGDVTLTATVAPGRLGILPATATLAVELGDQAYCGAVRLRRR